MVVYNRDVETLERNACVWWPNSLDEIAGNTSVIPLLLDTQCRFLSILNLADSVDRIFDLIEASSFSPNLFLKHLMVLTDFGGEPLQRVNRYFLQYFPDRVLRYSINGQLFEYNFEVLPSRGILNNRRMHTDIDGIRRMETLNGLHKDLIVLLMFGANSTNEIVANIFGKCVIGNMLNCELELETYVKQRYICVSRITGGSQANDLGNAAQNHVVEVITNLLGDEYVVRSNGHIPGVSQNNRTETTFDLIVEHNGNYVGIEVSFQVTTNSTIERKAGQAQERFNLVNGSGNYIAYIIDGAGNFQRRSALSTICQYSHCTVAYTEEEFEVLAAFIREKIG